MDHQAVLSRFDRQMRRNAEPDGPGGRVERVDGVVRQTGAEVGSWNGVVWSDLDENSADAAIAAQVRHFTELGREFEWKVYGHDLPHDLPQRLTAAGFVPEPVETLLVAEVADLPTDVPPPGGIRLLPVTDETGVDLMSQVHDKAFGRSLGLTRQQLLAQLAEDPDAAPAVLALAGDVPVSATAWRRTRARTSRACGAAARSPSGAGAGSTAASSRSVPASPPSAATATSRSTPPA